MTTVSYTHLDVYKRQVRDILESAVSPQGRVKLGSLLADMGRRAKLSDEEFAVFEQVRSKAPARPVSFE